MPLQPPDSSYRDERVEAFFDNLLPDGPEIRRRIQILFGTRSPPRLRSAIQSAA